MLCGMSVRRTAIRGATTLSVATSGVTRSAALSAVYAGISYSAIPSGGGANIFEYSNNASGASSYTVSRGFWCDYAANQNIWVSRTITSGSLNSSDPGTERYQMSSPRLFEVVDTSIPDGAVTCTLTINFYDAASGGNLLDTTGSITLSAERTA